MNNRKTSNRLERRAERAGRQLGSTPRPQRQRRTPVKVGNAGGFNWTLVGGVLGVGFIAVILIYAVVQSTSDPSSETPEWMEAQLDDSADLPGQYIAPHPGPDGTFPSGDDRQHFGNGVVWPICTDQQLEAGDILGCYTSNPPTSGPHAQGPAQIKILDNPAPKESLLHTMEHGAVIVWYNTDDQDLINRLKDVVQEQLDRRRLVAMSKYTEMEPNTIALTAWTRLDKFSASEFTPDRVADFIEAHQRRFNPEGF